MRLGRRRWFRVAAGAVAGGLAVPSAHAAAGGLTFEIYADARQEFRWRLKSANGQVIAASGQGYKAKADCRKGVELIKREAGAAAVEDLTKK